MLVATPLASVVAWAGLNETWHPLGELSVPNDTAAPWAPLPSQLRRVTVMVTCAPPLAEAADALIVEAPPPWQVWYASAGALPPTRAGSANATDMPNSVASRI